MAFFHTVLKFLLLVCPCFAQLQAGSGCFPTEPSDCSFQHQPRNNGINNLDKNNAIESNTFEATWCSWQSDFGWDLFKEPTKPYNSIAGLKKVEAFGQLRSRKSCFNPEKRLCMLFRYAFDVNDTIDLSVFVVNAPDLESQGWKLLNSVWSVSKSFSRPGSLMDKAEVPITANLDYFVVFQASWRENTIKKNFSVYIDDVTFRPTTAENICRVVPPDAEISNKTTVTVFPPRPVETTTTSSQPITQSTKFATTSKPPSKTTTPFQTSATSRTSTTATTKSEPIISTKHPITSKPLAFVTTTHQTSASNRVSTSETESSFDKTTVENPDHPPTDFTDTHSIIVSVVVTAVALLVIACVVLSVIYCRKRNTRNQGNKGSPVGVVGAGGSNPRNDPEASDAYYSDVQIQEDNSHVPRLASSSAASEQREDNVYHILEEEANDDHSPQDGNNVYHCPQDGNNIYHLPNEGADHALPSNPSTSRPDGSGDCYNQLNFHTTGKKVQRYTGASNEPVAVYSHLQGGKVVVQCVGDGDDEAGSVYNHLQAGKSVPSSKVDHENGVSVVYSHLQSVGQDEYSRVDRDRRVHAVGDEYSHIQL